MRYRIHCAILTLAAGLLVGPGSAHAQFVDGGNWSSYEVPPDDPVIPIPTGSNRMELGGMYVAGEYVFMDQTRSLGSQQVAFRGIIDATGIISGRPGTIIGSRREALNTDDLGRGSYQPGFKTILGYKFESGFTLEASYMNLFEASYAASASVIPPFFAGPPGLFDNFVTAAVFNFPPQFNGPVVNDTTFDAIVPGTTVGIWNAADVMDIKFTQRYTQVDITGRSPIFQTEYARSYFLAGGRYAWFWEGFTWRTTDYDFNNFAIPEFAAKYSNILSQRMYGPFIDCGHDINMGAFAVSLDVTGAALVSVNKERAKYARVDRANQAKRSQLEYSIVPNLNAQVNLWWYPTSGVQMRIGYTAMNFFNTYRMDQPIGFNFGAIDPVYDRGFYRLVHGFNVGIGLSF